MDSNHSFSEYRDTMQKIADIRAAGALMQWDEETYMPKKGAAVRAKQLATLQQLAHSLFIDPKLRELMEKLLLSNGLDDMARRNLELSIYDHDKAARLPSAFVGKLSEAISTAFHAWIKAREENSFAVFLEPLDTIIQLKKQEAEYLGYKEHPYDALLNDYEKGMTVKKLDALFSSLIPDLSKILDQIRNSPQVSDELLKKEYPSGQQWDLGLEILGAMGFDFESGRQDKSEHPFSTSFHPHDVRITTRIDEHNLASMTWSCIHEGGHGLYEQGLLPENYGLPLGEACSYSIHESQSRLWENSIGRSLGFCRYLLPLLNKYFPQQMEGISVEEFYGAINKVSPSLIRTEADEITYHFHVLIRYELEKQLIDGTLSAKDIPSWWNEKYKHRLGIDVPDDRQGCLQDVHWSHGSFGYFPTYSLGSLYAAQFYSSLEKAVPANAGNIEKGLFSPSLSWLRKTIHPYGRYYIAEELCKKVTGENLDPKHFLSYLQVKYSGIYGY